MSSFTALILAAGEGSRFNSHHPKLLHPLGGWPMLDYCLAVAEAAGAEKILLVAPSAKHPVALHAGKRVKIVEQPKPLGTGDAVERALAYVPKGDLMVLYGDVPLLRPQTLRALRQIHGLKNASASFVTAFMADPYGYGRIIRGGGGNLLRIVEEADATSEERKIHEINGGCYLFPADILKIALEQIKPRKTRGVLLTDVVQRLLEAGGTVEALTVPDASEVLGINTRQQLSSAHRILNRRRLAEFERRGVTFLDPKGVEIGPEGGIGRDAIIEGGGRLEGKTSIGEDSRIESGSVLVDATIGRSCVVRASRVLDSVLGDGSDAGPHAFLRGGCVIAAGCHVGAGTEMKKVTFGKGSKAGHFSYLGDAVVGKGVNVGAGCVFANYDGKAKHETKVGDGAFLGSNSTLVAPVVIGPGAVVGAGAVVTRDVRGKRVVVGVPAREVKKGK